MLGLVYPSLHCVLNDVERRLFYMCLTVKKKKYIFKEVIKIHFTKIYKFKKRIVFETMSCYVTQAGLQLRILLYQPPECWDDSWALLHLAKGHLFYRYNNNWFFLSIFSNAVKCMQNFPRKHLLHKVWHIYIALDFSLINIFLKFSYNWYLAF
jgi:hypothetical protein